MLCLLPFSTHSAFNRLFRPSLAQLLTEQQKKLLAHVSSQLAPKVMGPQGEGGPVAVVSQPMSEEAVAVVSQAVEEEMKHPSRASDKSPRSSAPVPGKVR